MADHLLTVNFFVGKRYVCDFVVVAFQVIGKFKRVNRADDKNLLKWTSKDHMLFDEDEEIVAFERKPKGFVEVDKELKRSKLF